jgi:hypothetical protein
VQGSQHPRVLQNSAKQVVADAVLAGMCHDLGVCAPRPERAHAGVLARRAAGGRTRDTRRSKPNEMTDAERRTVLASINAGAYGKWTPAHAHYSLRA